MSSSYFPWHGQLLITLGSACGNANLSKLLFLCLLIPIGGKNLMLVAFETFSLFQIPADLANLSNRSQADFSKLASSLDFVRHPYRGRLNRSPDWASRKLASATIKSFAPFGPLCARNCASAFRRGSRIVAPRGRFWSARPRSRSIALRVASYEFTPTSPHKNTPHRDTFLR